MTDSLDEDLVRTNQLLLDCIARGDWVTYKEMCEPGLTAFEPEAHGQLVEGLQFHYFFFDLYQAQGRNQTTMINPRVKVLGDIGIVAYVRLNQRAAPDGTPVTSAYSETRIWRRHDEHWRQVHFHRSTLS